MSYLVDPSTAAKLANVDKPTFDRLVSLKMLVTHHENGYEKYDPVACKQLWQSNSNLLRLKHVRESLANEEIERKRLEADKERQRQRNRQAIADLLPPEAVYSREPQPTNDSEAI